MKVRTVLDYLTKIKLIMSLASIMIAFCWSYSMIDQNALAVLNNRPSILSVNNFTFAKQGSFIDSHGMLNIVGVVDNAGTTPSQVRVGLNVTKKAILNTKLRGMILQYQLWLSLFMGRSYILKADLRLSL